MSILKFVSNRSVFVNFPSFLDNGTIILIKNLRNTSGKLTGPSFRLIGFSICSTKNIATTLNQLTH